MYLICYARRLAKRRGARLFYRLADGSIAYTNALYRLADHGGTDTDLFTASLTVVLRILPFFYRHWTGDRVRLLLATTVHKGSEGHDSGNHRALGQCVEGAGMGRLGGLFVLLPSGRLPYFCHIFWLRSFCYKTFSFRSSSSSSPLVVFLGWCGGGVWVGGGSFFALVAFFSRGGP